MRKALILTPLLFLTACNEPAPTQPPIQQEVAVGPIELPAIDSTLYLDPHSYATQEVVVKHLDWDANVDFDQERITATATWTLAQPHGTTLVLDVKGLDIVKVTVDGAVVEYQISEEDPLMGSALEIPVNSAAEKVSVAYKTTADAEALQWFPASLTQGGRHPFLFTQSQAILARTWLPCQDSPGIRFTYNAKVKVPAGLMALMSASNPTQKSADGVYTFTMPQAIPSYLMALGVGDVEFAKIGDRSGVYAEPEMVRNAAFEFAQTEDMIVAAEGLYGTYFWNRYDMLVLPPSFPFGGMENPRLTFVTPTVIVGDGSLVSLIAHELAHSWSGNLVTNATWNDFWLNEGFTVYFEMRIMERIYGREFADMLSALSYDDLKRELEEMQATPEATKLKQNLVGKNPDDAVTAIAYDKGFHFIKLCEITLGREKWDAFLKGYFEKYRFKTMVTESFLHELAAVLSPEQWHAIGVEEWVYGTGLPANVPFAVSNRFATVDEAVLKLVNTDPLAADARTAAYLPQATTIRWSALEWLRYIREAESHGATEGHYALMDNNYGFTGSPNPEIAAAWFTLTLSSGYSGHDETLYRTKVEEFLTTVGRRKFIVPMYAAMLNGSAERQQWAKDIYQRARPAYHPLAQGSIDALFAE